MNRIRRTEYIKPKMTNQQLAQFIKSAVIIQSQHQKQHGKLLGN